MSSEIPATNPEPLLPPVSQSSAISFKCPTLQQVRDGAIHVAGKTAELLFRTVAAASILLVGGALAFGVGLALYGTGGGWILAGFITFCLFGPAGPAIVWTSPLWIAGGAIGLAAKCYKEFTLQGPVNFQLNLD